MSEVLNFYNYLHTIPEEGFQELKTSAFLAEKLESYGYDVTRNVAEKRVSLVSMIAVDLVLWWRFVPTWMRLVILSMVNMYLVILVVMMDICQCCWLRLKLLKESN